MRRPLDGIDRKILDELQVNGRLSIVDLAKRVNLSKTPCTERVRRLEKSGVISQYRAILDPTLVDMKHVTIVHISLTQTATIRWMSSTPRYRKFRSSKLFDDRGAV